MSLTPLVVPKRNQHTLNFPGPYLPPPDDSEAFSSFFGWGTSGSGFSRLVAAGGNDTSRTTSPHARYRIDVVKVADDSYYGAAHSSTTTSGPGYLTAGTNFYLTEDALNIKLLAYDSASLPMGIISVDLDGSTVVDGGDTISVTLNNDGYIGSHSGLVMNQEVQKFSSGYGVSWVTPTSAGVPAADGYYGITDDSDTHYHAFQNDSDYSLSRRWFHNTTDGTWNYTIVSAPSKALTYGDPYVQLYKWQPQSVGGGFVQTNYVIQLDDADDNTLFQDFTLLDPTKLSSLGPGTSDYAVAIHTNTQNTQLVGGVLSDSSVVRQTMFYFAPDFSWYDRVDITSDGTLTSAYVQVDTLGNIYLVGENRSGQFYAMPSDIPPTPPAPTDSQSLRAWRFPQDNHEFYVIQLSGDTNTTLVYDKLSNMWSQWNSPGFGYFRGTDGCPWEGLNVCCDTESGKVFQIDPVGRLDYETTPMTSQIFTGLTERFRTFVPCYMAELAVSEGQPPTGIDASSVGMRLRSGDGLTWFDHGTVPGEAIGDSVTVRWFGIGLMQSPGKVFEITDTGYARCISGFTIETGKYEVGN